MPVKYKDTSRSITSGICILYFETVSINHIKFHPSDLALSLIWHNRIQVTICYLPHEDSKVYLMETPPLAKQHPYKLLYDMMDLNYEQLILRDLNSRINGY